MSTETFTLDDLKRILLAGAGADETVDLDSEILDTEFELLGYESLALLETCGRIEREYGISLDESLVVEATTPRLLIQAVNEHLDRVGHSADQIASPRASSAASPVALVSGATSGIGLAIARSLAESGHRVFIGARSADNVAATVKQLNEDGLDVDGTTVDVRSGQDIHNFVQAAVDRYGSVDVLVNNAGGARGLEPVADADVEHWRWMWEANVMGTLHVTKALLPKLIASGDGLIVTVTSIAAVEIYDNGAGYTTAKHAQGVLHRTLRSELLGQPVRLTEVAPGMVQTEFSLNRFEGDAERADKVYQGVTPLVAEDIAEVIGFVASRPAHVDLDLIVVRPRDQVSGAAGSRFHRT